MSDLGDFKKLYSLSAQLIERMDKEQLMEVMHLLALHIADYRARYGEIPESDLLELVGVVRLTDEQAAMLRDGFQLLVGYLGVIAEGLEDGGPVH